jgi:hypothetical protein
MAQKNAKMGHAKIKGGGKEVGSKVNHRVTGSVSRGYTVVNAAGEDQGYRRNMWDAIDLRKALDSRG